MTKLGSASLTNSTNATAPAVSTKTATDKRVVNHPDYQAWQGRMLQGVGRLAKNEEERQESGKRLF